MEKSYHLCLTLFVFVLMGCSTSAGAEKLIKPGGEIGAMRVEQGVTVSSTRNFWFYCDFMPDEQEPFSITTACSLPPELSNVDIGIGWLATDQNIASNWDAITWELYIDGYQIDLESFDWIETTNAENLKSREYIVILQELSSGVHNLRLSWHSDIAVDDGFAVYQPGTYQQEVSFTVPE